MISTLLVPIAPCPLSNTVICFISRALTKKKPSWYFILMPKTQVTDGEIVEFDQMHALLVNLDHGSAAIIGEQSQNVENLVAMVRDSRTTGLVDA